MSVTFIYKANFFGFDLYLEFKQNIIIYFYLKYFTEIKTSSSSMAFLALFKCSLTLPGKISLLIIFPFCIPLCQSFLSSNIKNMLNQTLLYWFPLNSDNPAEAIKK